MTTIGPGSSPTGPQAKGTPAARPAAGAAPAAAAAAPQPAYRAGQDPTAVAAGMLTTLMQAEDPFEGFDGVAAVVGPPAIGWAPPRDRDGASYAAEAAAAREKLKRADDPSIAAYLRRSAAFCDAMARVDGKPDPASPAWTMLAETASALSDLEFAAMPHIQLGPKASRELAETFDACLGAANRLLDGTPPAPSTLRWAEGPHAVQGERPTVEAFEKAAKALRKRLKAETNPAAVLLALKGAQLYEALAVRPEAGGAPQWVSAVEPMAHFLTRLQEQVAGPGRHPEADMQLWLRLYERGRREVLEGGR